MKHYKFRVIFLENNKCKMFKTYTEIANELEIDYHTVREIHQACDGKIVKKRWSNMNQRILETIKIESIKIDPVLTAKSIAFSIDEENNSTSDIIAPP